MEEEGKRNRLAYIPATGYFLAHPQDKKKLEISRSYGNLTFPNPPMIKLPPTCANNSKHPLRNNGQAKKPAFTNIFEGPITTNQNQSPRPVFSLECPEECLSSLPEDDEFATVHSAPFLSRAISLYARGEPQPLQRMYSRRMSRSLPELKELNLKMLPMHSTIEEEEFSEDGDYMYEPQTQPSWRKKLDFVLCVICQTLGLNSIWRFPYYSYRNGGGSFILAYAILLLLCGIPLLSMELAVGQLTQSGPIAALGRLCPLFKGVGFSSIVASFILTAYYSVIVGWSLFYLFNSFYSLPRWVTCGHGWNTELCWNKFLSASHSSQTSVQQTVSVTSIPTSFDINSTDIDLMTEANSSLTSNIDTVSSSLSFDGSKKILDMKVNYTLSSQEFFDQKLLEVSNRIENLGELRFELLATIIFTWVLVYFALRKNALFKGKTVYVLAVISVIVLVSLFLRVLFLGGAPKGLRYLFKPQWETLSNGKVWLYALAQVIHSFGLILGSSVTIGSCNKQNNNMFRDTLILALTTVATILIISCIVFGTIGHLSETTGKSLDAILHKDPGLVFVIYSVAIGTTPVPSLWGVFFFIMFFWLGMDYQIKLVAVIVKSLEDSYSHFIKQRFQGHTLFLFIICVLCFFSSILYVTQAGVYFFQVTDHYVGVLSVIILGILEVIALCWIYGTKRLLSDIEQALEKKPSIYFQSCWAFVSPVILITVLIFSIVTIPRLQDDSGYSYSKLGEGVGWFLFSFSICWTLFIGINTFRKTPKTNFFIRIQASVEPKQHQEPLHLWDPKSIIVLNGTPYIGEENEEELEEEEERKELPQLSQHTIPFLVSKSTRETTI